MRHTTTPATDTPTLGSVDAAPATVQQLELLPSSDAPVQFRLDRRTRELGLAHIARIRRQLAEQAARRSAEQPRKHPPRAA